LIFDLTSPFELSTYDEKGSRSILPQYDGNFVKALQMLFDFEFDETKFVSPESMLWVLVCSNIKQINLYQKPKT
jgi:hypothetical protein